MARVLLIEDDPAVRKGVVLALRRRGHETATTETGEQGLQALGDFRPDLVLLDLMLPGVSGLEVCRRIRESSRVPIIILSARGEELDMIFGLEAGADDYLVKPASSELMEARMRAVLRRVAPPDPELAEPGPCPEGPESHGSLTIDRSALMISKNGSEIPLAPAELKLLLFLSETPGRVYTRQQLLERVWEYTFHGDVRLVDACVLRLRGRVEDDPRNPAVIQTVRGFGYRFGPL
ncbi:response regulator [Streptomyces erythrochromogenes]|uniref:response regulator n=1 Tax=Streptomyces erythrochromogenes TaxID=285574 RepID=UPI0036C4B74C